MIACFNRQNLFRKTRIDRTLSQCTQPACYRAHFRAAVEVLRRGSKIFKGAPSSSRRSRSDLGEQRQNVQLAVEVERVRLAVCVTDAVP
jgi:hypothetical protein